uniref:Immunoglobulin V-set domain-containing protein n=1 Tax=Electrophorus electricus TaxID=8005 RepID=A0AAY5EXI2_ELEEL
RILAPSEEMAYKFTFLSAVGSMLCAQIRKTGTEGNVAVIQCPYAKGYEAYLKYFCKGTYKDCVSVVKTDGKEPWAFQGRFSLHDNTEKKMFVVTITALRIEDTGQYCCGIESVGSDPFTVVQLTVSKGATKWQLTSTAITFFFFQ